MPACGWYAAVDNTAARRDSGYQIMVQLLSKPMVPQSDKFAAAEWNPCRWGCILSLAAAWSRVSDCILCKVSRTAVQISGTGLDGSKARAKLGLAIRHMRDGT